MSLRCDRCGDRIDGEDPSYRRIDPDGEERSEYCSVNCLTGESGFDEEAVRERLYREARAQLEV